MDRSTWRTFQISHELFWGYRMKFDLFQIDELGTVISLIKADLKTYLLQRNLRELADEVDELQLHSHEPKAPFKEWLRCTEPDAILYLCSHCRKKD